MIKPVEPKKILCIHDLSGVGRCSLAVILPVLSVMGAQPVALPTVVLSTHTGGLGDPARLDRKELYLDDLCVDASVRGKGVAKLLWQRTVELARELGCDAVTLNVWEGNDRARKFYENCGLTVRKTFLEYPL